MKQLPFGFMIALSTILTIAGCGKTSIFESIETKKEDDYTEVTNLLEQGNHAEAKKKLLEKLPGNAALIIQSDRSEYDDSYLIELVDSMAGVADGPKILSIYATADAESSGVGALSIITELAKVDAKESKSSSLRLRGKNEEKAVSDFFPAMPTRCETEPNAMLLILQRIEKIIETIAVLEGFDKDQVSSAKTNLRSALSDANSLNGAIFSQVQLICPLMNFDTNKDTVLSQEELTIESKAELVEQVYDITDNAIAWVGSMVAKSPDNKNLTKALNRMTDYKAKMDAIEGTVYEKIVAFLVVNTAL